MMLPEFSTRLMTLACSSWRALMERYWQMMATMTRHNTPYLITNVQHHQHDQCKD